MHRRRFIKISEKPKPSDFKRFGKTKIFSGAFTLTIIDGGETNATGFPVANINASAGTKPIVARTETAVINWRSLYSNVVLFRLFALTSRCNYRETLIPWNTSKYI